MDRSRPTQSDDAGEFIEVARGRTGGAKALRSLWMLAVGGAAARGGGEGPEQGRGDGGGEPGVVASEPGEPGWPKPGWS